MSNSRPNRRSLHCESDILWAQAAFPGEFSISLSSLLYDHWTTTPQSYPSCAAQLIAAKYWPETTRSSRRQCVKVRIIRFKQQRSSKVEQFAVECSVHFRVDDIVRQSVSASDIFRAGVEALFDDAKAKKLYLCATAGAASSDSAATLIPELFCFTIIPGSVDQADLTKDSTVAC